MRSLLRVAPDAALIQDGLTSGADAIVIALGSDRVSDAHRRGRLEVITAFLQSCGLEAAPPLCFLGLDGLDSQPIDEVLRSLPVEPDGILLSDCQGGMELQHLGAKLAVYEAERDLPDGSIGVVAEAGSTARSILSLSTYAEASARLIGLAWDAGRLAADLGCTFDDASTIEEVSPLATSRNLVLIAARAAGVSAIDTASQAADESMFRKECERARRHGFNAKIAMTMEQVRIINAVFDRALEVPESAAREG